MEFSATPSTKVETTLASKSGGLVPLPLLEGASRMPWTSLPASQSRDTAILFCVRVPVTERAPYHTTLMLHLEFCGAHLTP